MKLKVSMNRSTAILLQVVFLFTVSVLIRLPNLNHGPSFDELYHVLAGRSWCENGSLAIAGGEYVRASAFTKLVGVFFCVFGESLAMARLPSVFAVSLLVVGLFLWMRHVSGAVAGWLAALMLCFAHDSIVLSQFSRFYTLHALAFWIGAISCYATLTADLSKAAAAGCAAISILAFAFSTHLQIITAIGLCGLLAWIMVELGPRQLAKMVSSPRLKRMLYIATIVALPIMILFFSQGDLLGGVFKKYRHVALWKTDDSMDTFYYLRILFKRFAFLWLLLPVAAWRAIRLHPRAGRFCTIMLVVPLFLHSFAGMKHPRYIYYTMPFLFALYGIAMSEAIPHLRQAVLYLTSRWLAHKKYDRLGTLVRGFLYSSIVLIFMVVNPSFVVAISKISGKALPWQQGSQVDWEKAKQFFEPLLPQYSAVVTTNDLFCLYYLGRYDFMISASRVGETDTGKEFGIDPRTGWPAISSAESLQQVISCHSSGLFISDQIRWRNLLTGIKETTADLLISLAEPVELPASWKLVAYKWEHSEEP